MNNITILISLESSSEYNEKKGFMIECNTNYETDEDIYSLIVYSRDNTQFKGQLLDLLLSSTKSSQPIYTQRMAF